MITAKTRWSMVSVLATLALVLSGCASDASSESTGTKDSATPEPSVTQETATPSEATPTETATEPENPGLSQEELDEQLRDAAWANDIEAAEQLISWGADVNAKDSTVQSAYLITTSEGYFELLELTLENGADVTALDSWNGTGLIRAAERGHWEVVGILLQNGIDVDHVNRIGYQAIHEAVIFGRDDPTYYLTLQVLVAGGSSLTTPSVSQGMTPLQLARREGFSGQIAVLEALEGPAPENPEAALLEAAASGDANAVALALRAGAEVDAQGDDGRSAREIAEDAGNSEAASLIRVLGG